MALLIHTAAIATRRDGGLACYGVAVVRPGKCDAALHTEWGACCRGPGSGPDLASLQAAVRGMEWFARNTTDLPVGEPAGLYVDRVAAASYIEHLRSRALTGRPAPRTMDGGQGVDFTLLIRLRALADRCTNLAVTTYSPRESEQAGSVLELAERSLVAELEESRRARAGEVELTPLGKGLFWASGRYEVDALLLHCECKDFEINNSGRLGKYPVRCKHLFAAQTMPGLLHDRHESAAMNARAVAGESGQELTSRARPGGG